MFFGRKSPGSSKSTKQRRDPAWTGQGAGRFGPDLDFAANEAYNLLRTNLLFSFPEQKGGKVVGITSSMAQEGKSFTSINLSYALAEAGYDVLLIDADMRKASVAQSLGLPPSPGLSNFLVNSENCVVHKNVLHPHMSLVAAGDIPPNPSELLNSDHMKRCLSFFAENYDFVIVDLPPVSAVSDPLIVSKHLDGIIVLVRHGYTRHRDVMETIRQLKFTNVRILGFVYNAYGKRSPGYGKGYENYYQKSGASNAATDGGIQNARRTGPAVRSRKDDNP